MACRQWKAFGAHASMPQISGMLLSTRQPSTHCKFWDSMMWLRHCTVPLSNTYLLTLCRTGLHPTISWHFHIAACTSDMTMLFRKGFTWGPLEKLMGFLCGSPAPGEARTAGELPFRALHTFGLPQTNYSDRGSVSASRITDLGSRAFSSHCARVVDRSFS